MGIIWSVAVVTTPVRPMPPAVAQKRAGSDEADRVTVPVGVTNVISRTWEQKLPSTWWFLPWMSAAMAPPTVTSRVPGVTGTNQPSGTRRSIRVCRLTPAPTVTWPDTRSTSWMASSQVASRTDPPAFWAASP